jgi:hypothetical protein
MRQRHHHHGERREDSAVWTVVAFGLAALLTIGVAAVKIARSVEIGPHVGDIISFRPGAQIGYAEQTEIAAPVAGEHGFTCILSPVVMGLDGGSLVVEEKEASRPLMYRVHWAGSHTSRGRLDCGGSADLTLSLSELLSLAEGAGGFGVHSDDWIRFPRASTSGIAIN